MITVGKLKQESTLKETPSAHFVTRGLSQKEKLQDMCEILIQVVNLPIHFVPSSMIHMMVSTNMKNHIHMKISDIHVLIVIQSSSLNFNYYHIHASTTMKKESSVLSVTRNIQV